MPAESDHVDDVRGVTVTLFLLIRPAGIFGSSSKTSIAARLTLPLSNASIRASVSTTDPLEELMKKTPSVVSLVAACDEDAVRCPAC